MAKCNQLTSLPFKGFKCEMESGAVMDGDGVNMM